MDEVFFLRRLDAPRLLYNIIWFKPGGKGAAVICGDFASPADAARGVATPRRRRALAIAFGQIFCSADATSSVACASGAPALRISTCWMESPLLRSCYVRNCSLRMLVTWPENCAMETFLPAWTLRGILHRRIPARQFLLDMRAAGHAGGAGVAGSLWGMC